MWFDTVYQTTVSRIIASTTDMIQAPRVINAISHVQLVPQDSQFSIFPTLINLRAASRVVLCRIELRPPLIPNALTFVTSDAQCKLTRIL
jgi:hypothetical protein